MHSFSDNAEEGRRILLEAINPRIWLYNTSAINSAQPGVTHDLREAARKAHGYSDETRTLLCSLADMIEDISGVRRPVSAIFQSGSTTVALGDVLGSWIPNGVTGGNPHLTFAGQIRLQQRGYYNPDKALEVFGNVAGRLSQTDDAPLVQGLKDLATNPYVVQYIQEVLQTRPLDPPAQPFIAARV